MERDAYVDIRGPWPTLVIGFRAFLLEGCHRDITVDEAIRLVKEGRV